MGATEYTEAGARNPARREELYLYQFKAPR
jgi:hypothetical protein